MRVLYLSSDTRVGGVESFLITLARSGTIDPSCSHDLAFTDDGPAVVMTRDVGAEAHYLGRSSFRKLWKREGLSRVSRSGIERCRWNVRMTRFPSDPIPGRWGTSGSISSGISGIGCCAWGRSGAWPGNGATAALAETRGRSKHRRSASDPPDYRRF